MYSRLNYSPFPIVQKPPKQRKDHLTVMSLGLVEPEQDVRTRRLPGVQGLRHVLLERSLDEAKAAFPVSICYEPFQCSSITKRTQIDLLIQVINSNSIMIQIKPHSRAEPRSRRSPRHIRKHTWMGPPDRRRRAPRDKFHMPLVPHLIMPKNNSVCVNLDKLRVPFSHTLSTCPSMPPPPLLDQHSPFSGHCLQHDQSPPSEVSAACPVSPANACPAPKLPFFSRSPRRS